MKKVALICGSPKPKRSASVALLSGLREYLSADDRVLTFHFGTSVPAERDLLQICTCQVLVFAFPLYVDGVPGHLLACMERLEATLSIAPSRERMVYAVCNCGFYEGVQNRLALRMIAHWCTRAGQHWGWGLGVGAGGMLAETETLVMGRGPKKEVGKALMVLAHDVDAGKTGVDRFVTANLPRAVYKTAAEFGWRQSIRRNGLRPKDLALKR